MSHQRNIDMFFVLIVVAQLIDHIHAKPPAMRWAQDKENIFLTISVDCASDKVFIPKARLFDLSCKRSNGENFAIKFDLREAIKSGESSCKTVRGEEECKLSKLHPHFFDRLTRDLDSLKQVLKPDWSRWKDEDESPTQPDDHFDGVTEIRQMTTKDIDSAVDKGAIVVAEISFPWCTYCSYTRKILVSAAKALSSENHIFASVDARDDYEASARFNVTCDYKCNLYVLQKDETPSVVPSKSNEADMIKELKPYFTPSITTLSSDVDFEKFKEKHPVFALALLKSGFMSKAKDSDEYKALHKAAHSIRGKVAVAFSEQNIGGYKPPSIQVFGNFSDARTVPVSKNDTELARLLLLESLPLVDHYSWQKRELYDGLGLPIVHAFIDEKSSSSNSDLDIVTSAANEFHGRLAFIQFKKADDYLLKDFGLPEKMPALGIALNFSYNSVKYGLEGNFDSEGVHSFLSAFLKGNLPPSFKSEPIPAEESKPGKVRPVVWKTLHKVVGEKDSSGPKEETLLMLYKPWARNREKAVSVIEKVAEALEEVSGFSVASIDTSKNHIDNTVLSIDQDDENVVLFLCRGDGSIPEKYVGSVTQKDVLKFVAKKVATVRASWEGSVKIKLKKMKEAEAEKKRLKEEQEKAEAEKKAQELKRVEELVASAEKVDVGDKKDGGIVKQIIVAGEGSSPSKGDKVKAHYTGTLLDGTKFDSSRDRGDPFSFTLGQGQVIPCWDQSFAAMRKGERAMLTCTAPYAYGDRGSPPKIPAGATLRFDVELLSFGKDEL